MIQNGNFATQYPRSAGWTKYRETQTQLDQAGFSIDALKALSDWLTVFKSQFDWLRTLAIIEKSFTVEKRKNDDGKFTQNPKFKTRRRIKIKANRIHSAPSY